MGSYLTSKLPQEVVGAIVCRLHLPRQCEDTLSHAHDVLPEGTHP